MSILQWWNLIFVLPAVAAILYLALLAFGALPAEGHDLDTDFDHDADLGHGADHGDADASHGALSLLGVGRVPLSFILTSLLVLWGFFGWLGTQVFGTFLPFPELFIWPSLVLALVGSVAFTRALAIGLGRIMPATESYGADARALVGLMADVRYPLTETSGSVQIHDRHGSLHEVPARVLPGEPAIAAGERVVLWRFDERTGAYFAVQDEALSGIESRSRGVDGESASRQERARSR